MPGHHCRLGFGYPSISELEAGLDALSKAMREAAR
jgi:DNA-binding transcriptional MocR family regulator